MTPVSRLHSHRYWLNWLATNPVIHSLTSVIKYTLTITLLMNTVFYSHSLKPSHHCSCYTIHCGRSFNSLPLVYKQVSNQQQTNQRINSYRVTNTSATPLLLTLPLSLFLSLAPLQYRLRPYCLISSLLCDCLDPRHEHKLVYPQAPQYNTNQL